MNSELIIPDDVKNSIPQQVSSTLQQQLPDTLSRIENLLARPDFNMDALEKLIQMQKDAMEYQAKLDFSAAMARFNALKKIIPHNQTGKTAGNSPFSYADYSALVNAVTPWLAEAGLSFSHSQGDPVINDKGQISLLLVTCTITHISGHSESYSFPAAPDSRLEGKVSPSQLIQMAITYAKRQTLSLALGLATYEDNIDDDGAVSRSTRSRSSGGKATEPQVRLLKTKLNHASLSEGELCKHFDIDNIDSLPKEKVNDALAWIKNPS